MLVSDVLASKGSRIETASPAQSAREMPRLFVERNVASVVVVNSVGQPMGIVTERHLLQAMARTDCNLAGLWVRDIMVSPAPSCRPEDKIATILARMTNERIRHLLVIDQEKMVGVVSIGDLVKQRLAETELEARTLRDMALAHMVA